MCFVYGFEERTTYMWYYDCYIISGLRGHQQLQTATAAEAIAVQQTTSINPGECGEETKEMTFTFSDVYN